jgi:hypothetical protein
LSIAHALTGDDKTYKEVMQKGVLHLLQSLEEHHPLEYTALLTFSSTGKVFVPFTRDFAALKNALFNLKIEDRSNVLSGLKIVTEYTSSSTNSFGSHFQVILVTNGCSSSGRLVIQSIISTDKRVEADKIMDFELPSNVKMHIIGFGTRANINADVFSALAWKTKGTFEFIESPHGAPLMKQAFAKILEVHYVPYQGILACGHLHTRITLYPNPNFAPVTAANAFPTTLSVIGFLPNKRIQSPPSMSRHFVLPAGSGPQPLCQVLHDALRNERMSAIVQFGTQQTPQVPEWLGLLNSVSERGDLSCLVLSVLKPGEVFPHFGKLSDLVPAPAPNQSPLMAVRPQHARSYNTPKEAVLVSLTADALQADCGKIARYARALPAKLEFLYMECERLRQTAQTYSCPGIMNGVISMLQQELVNLETQLGQDSEAVQHLHEFLTILLSSPSDIPLKFIRGNTRKNSTTSIAPPGSMSINSLLS